MDVSCGAKWLHQYRIALGWVVSICTVAWYAIDCGLYWRRGHVSAFACSRELRHVALFKSTTRSARRTPQLMYFTRWKCFFTQIQRAGVTSYDLFRIRMLQQLHLLI
jgi:hypothetical protein